MTVPCACGCGVRIENRDSRNRPRRFISGHNKSTYRPDSKETISCKFCAKHFSAYKANRRSFCSRHCKAKWIGRKLKNDLEYKERQRQLSKANGNKPPLHKGEAHWNWKGGISKINRGQDYRAIQWRKDVLVRFNFTCQLCGIRGGRLSAHHILGWAKYPEYRYDLENGLCLHYTCHMWLHGLSKICPQHLKDKDASWAQNWLVSEQEKRLKQVCQKNNLANLPAV